MSLVNNTTHDSFELYYGLFLYNRNAMDELERMEKVRVGVSVGRGRGELERMEKVRVYGEGARGCECG